MTWNFALTTTPVRWVGRGSVALRSAIVRSRCARDAPVPRAWAARAEAPAARGTAGGLRRGCAVCESQWHKAGIRHPLGVAPLGGDALKATHHIAVHHV